MRLLPLPGGSYGVGELAPRCEPGSPFAHQPVGLLTPKAIKASATA
jgi:hypothetical protein